MLYISLLPKVNMLVPTEDLLFHDQMEIRPQEKEERKARKPKQLVALIKNETRRSHLDECMYSKHNSVRHCLASACRK